MSLGAAFWSGGGASYLWQDLDTFTEGTLASGASENMYEILVGPCKIYQEPLNIGGKESRAQNNPGYDSGYFYALETTTGFRISADGVFPLGLAYPEIADNAQYVKLVPSCEVGDLIPITTSSSPQLWRPKDSIYRTGFQKAFDAGNPAPVFGGPTNISMSLWTENIAGTYRLWHYSPWAWSGSPAGVVAAAAMFSGLSADQIDQDAFDDAHDAYNATTGDAPYTDLDEDWTIYARRTLGQNVAKFLLECADHGRDFVFVNEEGKLSTSSFTNPTFTTAGLDLEDDQVLDIISWTSTRKHLFNAVSAGWGSAARQSYESSSAPSGQSVTFEPNLESRPPDKWVHDDTDATSITNYGQVWLKGKKVLANFRGHPQEIQVSHYPFLLTTHIDIVPPSKGYDWEPADGGGMVHVTYWLVSDSSPRSEIEVKQGPMGFDTAIGDEITDLEITGDGKTIAASRVIEKKYNFDDMTIESLIMEIPPNS